MMCKELKKIRLATQNLHTSIIVNSSRGKALKSVFGEKESTKGKFSSGNTFNSQYSKHLHLIYKNYIGRFTMIAYNLQSQRTGASNIT